MKTILVLTDFSINADYAAHYALKLAQKIEADLLLCNIYESSNDKQTTDRPAWPLEACETDSIEDLGALSARLKTLIDKDRTGLFRPGVSQCSYEGNVVDKFNEIAREHDILMALVSRHDANWLSTLISGNHTRDIIEVADFPVMIIPYQVRFNDYKTIAFATEMNYTDINVLESLTGLAKHMGSEIVVAQMADVFTNKKSEMHALKHFFNQIPGKIDYTKILYRILEKRTVINGLAWLAGNLDIDLLVLVHRRRNFFQKLFSDSITQQLAVFLNKPLLIFPSYKVKQTLSVF